MDKRGEETQAHTESFPRRFRSLSCSDSDPPLPGVVSLLLGFGRLCFCFSFEVDVAFDCLSSLSSLLFLLACLVCVAVAAECLPVGGVVECAAVCDFHDVVGFGGGSVVAVLAGACASRVRVAHYLASPFGFEAWVHEQGVLAGIRPRFALVLVALAVVGGALPAGGVGAAGAR